MSWPCCGTMTLLGCGGGSGDSERVAEEEDREPPSPSPSPPLLPPLSLVSSLPVIELSGSSSSSLLASTAPTLASVGGRDCRDRGLPSATLALVEVSSMDVFSWNAVPVSGSIVLLHFDWLLLVAAETTRDDPAPPSDLPALLALPASVPGVGRARSLTDRSRDAVRIQGGSSITFS